LSVGYQELLKRQAVERVEFLDRERRENTTVTIQHSTNRDAPPGPFIVEIVFPDNLKHAEKHAFAHEFHAAASAILEAKGYKVAWLQPKDEEAVSNCTT
jgi:hypothetical protein